MRKPTRLSARSLGRSRQVTAALATWANQAFGTTFDAESLMQSLQMTPQTLAAVGVDVAGGLIGVLVHILGGVFSLFSIGLFIFYFSADAPRLQRWVAHLLPPHRQEVFLVVWTIGIVAIEAWTFRTMYLGRGRNAEAIRRASDEQGSG